MIRGIVNKIFNSPPSNYASTPKWIKITKTYLDFAIEDLANDISIYTLPKMGNVHDIKIVTTEAFSGGTIESYELLVSAAKSSNVRNLSSGSLNGPMLGDNTTLVSEETLLETTDIRAFVSSSIGNLDEATAGIVDIYILVSLLP
jgi:hypothetical protein